tara:strand:- start:216 stop:1256 length:1041 start_codon:yes stop_codon:yes gene_type:complete
MTFFDKKEEVIQIELTQYGKYLLSVGRWKAVYYAFFDDNILYDGAHAGITETQNDIEPRIQENTPQLKPQYTFLGRESDFLKTYYSQKDIKDNDRQRIKMESPVHRQYSLQLPLGTIDTISQASAAWKITFLEGKVDTSTALLSSSYQTIPVPQVNCGITYNTSIKNISSTSLEALGDEYPEVVSVDMGSDIFSDGTYVSVQTDPFILLVAEENGIFEKENFDIEVFKSGTAGYEPLLFKKRSPQIINNLLVGQPVLPLEIDDTYVEYYFDVLVDTQISKTSLCRSITQLKKQHKYVDLEIECPEEGNITVLNPYVDAAPDSDFCEGEDETTVPSVYTGRGTPDVS